MNNTSNSEPQRNFSIDGNEFAASKLTPALYIVSTPIGNLKDITVRALHTLAAADLIACEDTRVTQVLLRHFGIQGRILSYHEHNADKVRPRILEELSKNGSVALVSDAGTPLISDPGYRLVKEAIQFGHQIVPIPGPSALLSALVGSGLETDEFLFAGFLPKKSTGRRKRLEELQSIPTTLIFYEAPNRLRSSLADMAEIMGCERSASVAREITKRYETIERGSLAELVDRFANPPKGEIVIIVGRAEKKILDDNEIDSMLLEQMKTATASEASAFVAKYSNLSRQDVYKRALRLKSESNIGELTKRLFNK